MPLVEAGFAGFKVWVCKRLLVVLVGISIAHVKARLAVARVIVKAFADKDEGARVRNLDIVDGSLHIHQFSARIYSVEEFFLLGLTTTPSLG